MRASKPLIAAVLLTFAACNQDDLVDDKRENIPMKPASKAKVPTSKNDAGAADPSDPTTEPSGDPFDAINWQSVGLGIVSKDTKSDKGTNAALVYAGYQADLDAAKGWASALYKADLEARGVRYLYAIQGPNDIEYTNKEIANTKLVAQLLTQVSATTKFILLLGHSSGSYVAHEILGQLEGSRDPDQKTKGKLVYFDLDGGKNGFTAAIAGYMKKAYFVSPRDSVSGTGGFNNGLMQDLATAYPNVGGLLPFESSEAGCDKGAIGCIHDSLVITKPHSPDKARPDVDYDDFVDRPVTTAYLTAKGDEAGLVP